MTATNSERILAQLGGAPSAEWALFDSATTRSIEADAAASLPPGTLMRRAGLAVARFAVAIAPHAKIVWIACGPGNNGGDGFQAAQHLSMMGKRVVVTWTGEANKLPADARAAWQGASDAGIVFACDPPDHYDLCVDAIFGIGSLRPLGGHYRNWVERMNSGAAPVVAIDLPSGLHADTGSGQCAQLKAQYTLCLLTLKPGLFTANGREFCGEIWFNDLGVAPTASPCALLSHTAPRIPRPHNSHKGSYGDVAIIGGCPGMAGASLLAARAALHGGAGRVYVGMLGAPTLQWDDRQPELMFRLPTDLPLDSMTVVAGCGGGDTIGTHLPYILKRARRLVLDADALNAIAQDRNLQDQLGTRGLGTTVLTPHPLEAARLLQLTTGDIQSDRLRWAQALVSKFACTVVLKGSGTVIAGPGTIPRINPTGNARLATAGTGDVLAGLIAAQWTGAQDSFSAACNATLHHGYIADHWPTHSAPTAQDLIRYL